MTFAEVGALVGGLPASARIHRAWWGNDRSHVQAKAWLAVNRSVGDVDLREAVVRFD